MGADSVALALLRAELPVDWVPLPLAAIGCEKLSLVDCATVHWCLWSLWLRQSGPIAHRL